MSKRAKDKVHVNNRRNVWKNFPRFLSLLIMSALGVFVFAGLQATSPDMISTLDRYLDIHDVYDLKIVSPQGFSQEDIDQVSKIEGVQNAQGSFTCAAETALSKEDEVLSVATVTEAINTLTLTAGRMPVNADEIVVEDNLLSLNDRKLGDSLTIDGGVWHNQTFKIVGTVDSPLYYNNVSIEQKRGLTSLGTGKIQYYAYALEDAFPQGMYTEIYVTVSGAKEEEIATTAYSDCVKQVKESIEKKLDDCYVYDRTDYATYTDYIDDAKSIANLSKIFPVVFFLVAVLVSLISMNRMVEDDRLEIGTLKSLGFGNSKIMSKYVSFSFLATAAGGVIGAVLGLIIIPSLIFNIYGILFEVPDFRLRPEWFSTILGFAITVVCVCGTSVWTAYIQLREKPSELMRPKAPKKGKRVLLENFPAIWSRLRFSNKITIRNIFRYKKRVLVTVGGIAGCTALMLIGFGVRDAVSDIAQAQFGGIFKYDATAYIAGADTKEQQEMLKEAFAKEEVDTYTLSERIPVKSNGYSAYILAVEEEKDLETMANLTAPDTKEKVSLEEGKVIITNKFSELTGLEAGDDITLEDNDHNLYTFTVSGIVSNYLEHYIYMDKKTLEQYMDFQPNTAYLYTGELSKEKQDQLSQQLLKNPQIIYLSFTDSLVSAAWDMLRSLDQVVLILIVLAAMLSFVVLYNLSNINISERRREIATLKVLGFYDNEVDSYITKENLILTFIGILIGLFAGYHLTHLVVSTVEIEKARFMNWISAPSYLYSAALACVFTGIVNVITHFKLKKIDMIDSLKSVE